MTDRDKASAILRAAADRIEPPGAWTQGAPARTAFGAVLIDHKQPWAKSWSAAGAISVASADRWKKEMSARAYLKLAVETDRLSDWNDAPTRTQQEVVAALRRAADIAEGRGE